MQKLRKITIIAAIAAVASGGVYTSLGNGTEISELTMSNVEAVAGCEVSSNGSENKGYCSSMVGGSGDACTTTGDPGAVRCSGNY